MQQLTGKIVSVQPTAEGGYNGTNGWINTYIMTIQGPNAQVTGEIGSKVTPYPLGVGQEITVNAEQTQHGMKFKKFNPQYSGGGGQRGGQQGSGQPSPDNREDRIIRGNALNAVMSAANIMPDEIYSYLKAGVQWIKTGVWNILGKESPQQDTSHLTGPDVGGAYESNDPAPVDDGSEIPF